MLLTFIILVLILLSAKRWIPGLMLCILIVIGLPFIPFVIAYKVKKEKPVTAISLVTIWSMVLIVSLMILLIPQA